jgi:hypothetical protein
MRGSRGKAERFLEEVGAEIVYPEDTSQEENQRGRIITRFDSEGNGHATL